MRSVILLVALTVSFLRCLKAQNKILLQPDEFEQKLTLTEVQLLDVRTAGEYQGSHLRNAFLADWTDLPEFKNRVQYLDKKKPVLIYCAVGGRSSKAAQWLRENGFDTVQELSGGITAWKTLKKPVEQKNSVKQMDMAEFTTLVSSQNRIMVEFGGVWCPPCKQMEPVLSQLQNELKGQFNLVRIDAGIHTNILKQLQISAFPTFIIYQAGKEIWRNAGITGFEELKAAVLK